MQLCAGSSRASRLLASIVLLAEFLALEIPETVDAVGIPPTASKLFGLDGTAEGIRTPDLLVRSSKTSVFYCSVISRNTLKTKGFMTLAVSYRRVK